MFKRKRNQNQPESDLLEPGVALQNSDQETESVNNTSGVNDDGLEEETVNDDADLNAETINDDDAEETEETDTVDEDSNDESEEKKGLEFEDPAMTELATRLQKELEAGELSEESIVALEHALHYDEDLEKASVEGELRGRNATIDEHLKLLEDSDGLPHPGEGQAGPSVQRRPMSIFDLARGAM
jgi:hypothetical protein